MPAEFQRADTAPYDKSGRLIRSVACSGCGYDLLGLDVRASCPECGAAVARSVAGDLLEFMDTERLELLHRRLGRVVKGTYLSVLMPIVGSLVSGLLFGLSFSATGGPPVSFALMNSVGLVLIALNAIGLVVLTTAWLPLGKTDGDSGQTRLDRAARRAGILMIVGYAASLAIQLLSSGPGVFGSAMTGLGGSPIVGIFVLLCYPVWLGCSAAYLWNAQAFLAGIAARAPDPLLVHRARGRRLSSVLWWTLGVLALFLGPLVAISNLLSTLKDVRFHTKRAREARAAAPVGAAAGAGARSDAGSDAGATTGPSPTRPAQG